MQWAASLVVLGLAACGSARVTQVTQAGGTIELSGDHGAAMDEANQKMAAQCGANRYTIVADGDEPVDASSGRTVWRVHYECNGVVVTPPPINVAPGSAS